MKPSFWGTFVLIVLVCSMVDARAQDHPAIGQIQGVVSDSFGKPLPDATVQLQATGGKVVGQTESDSDGKFSFKQIDPGTYALVAEKSGFQPGTVVVTLSADAPVNTTVTLASNEASEMQVIAKRLDASRNGLLPETGSSIYRLDQTDIQTLPQGVDTPINQVLLQAPGVAQDSFGQLHVRGDHANIQYRINGVIIPEGITGFGQVLDTRFADRINFLTGALPAQYGYRTAGVVDIRTKDGAFASGGRLDAYGGSYGQFEPSLELGGSKGAFNYYLTGSYLEDDMGIEPPTASPNPIHDHTIQEKGFGYFSYLISSTSRLSLILADSVGQFQIPNNPGQTPNFTLGGTGPFSSAALNENQRESNQYAILTLQQTSGSQLDYQISAFSRYSEVRFVPDPLGDLIFNGVASRVESSSFSNGLQTDGSYRLNSRHTLRSGFFVSIERAVSDNSSLTFPVDPVTGTPSTLPETVVDNNAKTAGLYGGYLQDEWRPVDPLTINYGARFDSVNAYANGSQLSPRLGAVYQLEPQTSLHAGYAHYFTPPPTELIAPKTLSLFANTTAAAAPGSLASNVLPERAHYFDVGATHQFTPALNLGLDTYYKLSQDLIDEGQFGQALVFAPFNYKKGKVYGAEFTANYRQDNLSSYLNFAYSRAMGKEIVSAQFNFDPVVELPFIANHFIHLDHDQTYTSSAGAAYVWNGTRFAADAIYGSGLRSGFANLGKLVPNFQVNLGLTRACLLPLVGKIEGRFTVLNLFDQVNELRSGTGVGVGAPQFATRRAFYGGINKPF